MKKLLFTLALLMTAVVGMQAQTATENSKFFDNISIGVTGGAATPLNFNSMFPVNPVVGLRLQKDFTPAFGLHVEGLAILNNNNVFADPIKTTVKGTNVGVNGVINLSNALFGYNGTPRVFEISTVTGLGWLHEWNTSANFLSAKTGFDLAFNLGSKKAHSIVITPAILWNLNTLNKIQFDKNKAQLMLQVSYVYHFKTSNGTHHFKTWDVGAMNEEINALHKQTETDKRKIDVLEDVIVDLSKKIKDQSVPTAAAVETKFVPSEWVVTFAKGSSTLDDNAKNVLKTIPANVKVKIEATASPEGSTKFNQTLSENRANSVAEFLKANGVTVVDSKGLGVTGNSSNRIAIVTVTD